MSTEAQTPRGGADLIERYGRGQRSLRGASLWRADLSGVRLDGADLSESDLLYANLEGASLRGARLRGAQLEGANCTGAVLVGAVLAEANALANITRAKLSRADLSGANLSPANLCEADLSDAILLGADMREALLDGAILYGATYDGETRWPPGLDPSLYGAIDLEMERAAHSPQLGEDHRPQGGFAMEPLVAPTSHGPGVVFPLSFWRRPEGWAASLFAQEVSGDAGLVEVGSVALTDRGIEERDGGGRQVRSVSFDRPFEVGLTVWPLADGRAQLGVSIASRGRMGAARLRLRALLRQDQIDRSLALQQIHSGFVDAGDFAQIWRSLVFHASLHGLELRGLVSL